VTGPQGTRQPSVKNGSVKRAQSHTTRS